MALTRNDISYLSTAVVTASTQLTPRMLRACQDAIVKLSKELEHRETRKGIARAAREDQDFDYLEAEGSKVHPRFIAEAAFAKAFPAK